MSSLFILERAERVGTASLGWYKETATSVFRRELGSLMTAVEMYNELVRQGYIKPASTDRDAMVMPSLYRPVATMTTTGTTPVTVDGSLTGYAELGRGAEGDQSHSGI